MLHVLETLILEVISNAEDYENNDGEWCRKREVVWRHSLLFVFVTWFL